MIGSPPPGAAAGARACDVENHADIATLTAAWNAERRIGGSACARLRGLAGCQTKMVLGVPCAAPVRLNASLLAEAVRQRDRSAEEQVAAMFDFVKDWASGRPLDDDCTIVVLRVD